MGECSQCAKRTFISGLHPSTTFRRPQVIGCTAAAAVAAASSRAAEQSLREYDAKCSWDAALKDRTRFWYRYDFFPTPVSPPPPHLSSSLSGCPTRTYPLRLACPGPAPPSWP